MVVAAFTDSSLYGSEGELIPDDDALKGYDKHKLHSQAGSSLVIMNKNHLDDVGDVPFSFADWRTRSSRRVLHSTFAAEAGEVWMSMEKMRFQSCSSRTVSHCLTI